MKVRKITSVLCALILIAGFSSCRVKTVNSNKNGIPPGQMKKVTGSQSAAPYAPGHN